METNIALTKGLIESLIYILEPGNKREVAAILKRNLRLAKDEDGEASARVAQLQMPSVEVGLSVDAWKTVQRLVARAGTQRINAGRHRFHALALQGAASTLCNNL